MSGLAWSAVGVVLASLTVRTGLLFWTSHKDRWPR